MLSPLPRRSDWAYCFAHFTQPCQPSPIWQSGRPAHCPFRGLLGVHSRYGLHTRAVTVFRDTLSEGFSHFVTSIAAPVASGWSGCRVGFAPTGKRRLFTAHATIGHHSWPVARPGIQNISGLSQEFAGSLAVGWHSTIDLATLEHQQSEAQIIQFPQPTTGREPTK